MALGLSLCKMRAHDRAVQPPAQTCLVTGLGLIARLSSSSFSSLTSMSIRSNQVFLDNLNCARLKSF